MGKKGEETKRFIREKSYYLFAQKGYRDTTMKDICESTGLSRGGLYAHYNSTEQILIEIVEESYIQDYSEALKSMKDILCISEYKQALLEFFYEILAEYESDLDWRKLCAEIELQAEYNMKIKEIVDRSNQNIFDFINKALEHGTQIGAFVKNFDIKANSETLLIFYLGLNASIFYNLKINAKVIIQAAIENMFN